MAKVRLLVFLLTIFILATFGTAAIFFAKGYRINFGSEEKTIEVSPTGLLVANSEPNGAQIFTNGQLKNATNSTIPLVPGEYDIEIKKEGFIPWKKHIIIKKEEVTQIDAFLIQSAPSLTPLTFSGIVNPRANDDFTKIAYAVPPEGDNGEKAGLWVLETVNLPLGFNRDPRRITDGDLTEAQWEWSPDGREIMLTTGTGVYLLNTNEYVPTIQRENITLFKQTTLSEWEEIKIKQLTTKLDSLEKPISEIFNSHAININFSPDENRILYTASGSATIPENVVKQLPGSSTQVQDRNIKDGKTYIYDIKEDRNFTIAEPGELVYWLSNSLNLLSPLTDQLIIMDYDGTNRQTILSGNYQYPHAYPSSNPDRILILTNLGSSDSLPNLYWLSLK